MMYKCRVLCPAEPPVHEGRCLTRHVQLRQGKLEAKVQAVQRLGAPESCSLRKRGLTRGSISYPQLPDGCYRDGCRLLKFQLVISKKNIPQEALRPGTATQTRFGLSPPWGISKLRRARCWATCSAVGLRIRWAVSQGSGFSAWIIITKP